MESYQLIFPMLAMVLLTASVLVRLFRARVGAVRAGALPASYFRTYQGSLEPDSTVKPGRHFVNLFEAPTLFYAVCLAAMIARVNGTSLLVLAWCYVGLRLIHAYIHLGANRVRFRILAYAASWGVLLAMWLDLAVGVALRGSAS